MHAPIPSPHRRRLARTLAFLALLPGAALAQDVIDGRDPDAILNIARGYGSALMETDEIDDPLIRGRIEGVAYLVYFYGCVDNKECRAIQFRSTFGRETTLESMNAWNRDHRFGTGYINNEGYPTLEYDVNLDYGVTPRNLDDTFDWWRVTLGEFKEHLEAEPATEEISPLTEQIEAGLPESAPGKPTPEIKLPNFLRDFIPPIEGANPQ
ncbi:YbjN domain-containing protein [Acuticoccus kandeliae]|uniref:YbjN domain-containing protein n=1 Tax=Acuticoccus kandeliae TaxID=2073160 RepID=UPI000D3ECD89|nr:YbjN domain-containing protein [Acuticoccus kandeliae]